MQPFITIKWKTWRRLQAYKANIFQNGSKESDNEGSDGMLGVPHLREISTLRERLSMWQWRAEENIVQPPSENSMSKEEREPNHKPVKS